MLAVLLFTTLSFVSVMHAKSQHAHAHGLAKIAIVFDGLSGKIEFHSPAEGIYGFEHQAKKEKDIKAQQKGLEKIKSSIGEMIRFQDDRGCVFAKEKVEVETEGKHAEVQAEFNVTCQKEITGSTIEFNVQKVFSRISKVEVFLVAGEIQKSAKANKIGTKLEVKK